MNSEIDRFKLGCEEFSKHNTTQPDRTWRKECPVCCVPLEPPKMFDPYLGTMSLKVVDKRDGQEKIWIVPRHLLKEMNKALMYEFERVNSKVGWLKRIWYSLLHEPIPTKDPLDGKVFEIRRDDSHRFPIFSIKLKESA
jgi:hypothetical protein